MNDVRTRTVVCCYGGKGGTDLGVKIKYIHSSNTSINTSKKHPLGYMFRPNWTIMRLHYRIWVCCRWRVPTFPR